MMISVTYLTPPAKFFSEQTSQSMIINDHQCPSVGFGVLVLLGGAVWPVCKEGEGEDLFL